MNIVGSHKVEHDKVSRWNQQPKVHRIRVFVWPVGETILDNLFNRRNRPHRAWKQMVANAVAEAYHLQPDLDAPPKLKWSQYAGCKCGCSPGFIVENMVASTDLHLDVADGPVETRSREQLEAELDMRLTGAVA